jgi:hypothetical protein
LKLKLTSEEIAEVGKKLNKHRLIFFDWVDLGVANIFA